MKLVCFSGKSNSGKTTLICKLSELARSQGARVAVIKHDPANKAEFDTIGKQKNKDSYKFSCAANCVAVISPQKSAIFTSLDSENPDSEITEFARVVRIFGDYDFVFVEGLKHLPYKRIIVARDELDSAYASFGNIFAVSQNIRQQVAQSVQGAQILDLNDTFEILEFIKKEF